MKHLLTLTLFLGIAWGQMVTTRGTGLELNPISDFGVICERISSDGKRIGLNAESVEAKVKLSLRGNGTPSKGKKGSPYLYINIFVREDVTTSGRSLGHSVVIEVSFHRLVMYHSDANAHFAMMPEYGKFGRTWSVPERNLGLPPFADTKSEIMREILEMVDRFSIALLEANEK